MLAVYVCICSPRDAAGAYTYIRMYVYACTRTSASIYIHALPAASPGRYYVCMYVCICVCVCVCVCVYTYVYIHTYITI